MDSTELSEWMAFAEHEPIGDRRADLQAAIIASAAFNALGNKAGIDTFLPKFWKRIRLQCVNEMQGRLKMMVLRCGRALNGKAECG